MSVEATVGRGYPARLARGKRDAIADSEREKEDSMSGCVPAHFCEWQPPMQLLSRADTVGISMGEQKFLTSNDLKYAREAWVIGTAGVLLNASGARLECADPPDGYLNIEGLGTIPIEVTELLQKGRRRGDEDHTADRIQDHNELTMAIEFNAQWLGDLIGKKLAKDSKYPAGTILLIYHDTSLYNFDPARTRTELESASRLSAKNVAGSLILYGNELYGTDLLTRYVASTSLN